MSDDVGVPVRLRWRLAEDDGGQPALFDDDELLDRHVGRGEYRGLEFLHVNARRVINEVPTASRMPFRYTINAYRGCSHACVYCMSGDTPVLVADGRTRDLADLRPGDTVVGTEREGNYRRYVTTPVLAHWSTRKLAYRVVLADGTELVASGDHRFLTHRGWKHVTGAEQGLQRRPHLTLNDKLIGTGRFASPPEHTPDYKRGYLCGMVRGDGHLKSYHYERAGRANGDVHRFRLALTDLEALRRTQAFLLEGGVPTQSFLFKEAVGAHKTIHAVRTSTRLGVASIQDIVDWPKLPSPDWCKGFLAGIFDAEGSHDGCVRIANTDEEIIRRTASYLRALGFDVLIETGSRPVKYVRFRGGIRENLRFFHTVDPAITRKRTIDGTALKSDAPLGVVSVQSLGDELPMFDITTGTGDFIANGVVSHNCFARPTHDYLGLNIGEDFDRRIVVKVNAVERVRAELANPRWRVEPIAMGTNTDPYQRAEGKYRLTRGIVDALVGAGNPFSILTKSTLVLGDLDRLAEGARRTSVRTNLSIGTLDESVWRTSEPGTPHPRQRVAAVARLNEAGVPCGVLIAPVLPGLSDHPDQLEAVVDACVEAGAVSVSTNALHLRPGVRQHYLAWLERTYPDLVETYRRRYRRSAYVPGADQRELSALVARLVDAALTRRGGRSRAGATRSSRTDRELAPGGRSTGQADTCGPHATHEPSPAQLDLGL
ncbi:MAG TPA: intein-containing Rv2578c family radical SAM protein [Acidimicrobiales bacterium]